MLGAKDSNFFSVDYEYKTNIVTGIMTVKYDHV